MKVIAQINDNMVLCEVSQNEIARLHGVPSRYDKEWDTAWLKVGAEHDMISAFIAVDTVRGFDSSHIRYMQQRIDTLTEAFEKVKEAYEKLTLFDTLKEIKPEESK